MAKLLNRTFDAIEVDKPFWRNKCVRSRLNGHRLSACPQPFAAHDRLRIFFRNASALPSLTRSIFPRSWGIANSGQMDSHSYGTPEALAGLKARLCPSERFLQTEYETIRRLPKSRAILFGIKGYKAPLPSLGSVPGAAATLATSLRGMSGPLRAYKGLATPEIQQEMLEYLDGLAAQADGAGAVVAR